MVAIIHKRSWRDFDWILALLAIGIVLFGTIQIRNPQPTEPYWAKQLIGLGIGLGLARGRCVGRFFDLRECVSVPVRTRQYP